MRDGLAMLGVRAADVPRDFDALAVYYAGQLHATHGEISGQPRQLTDTLSERRAANVLAVSKPTLHSYRAASVPTDPAVLAALRRQLQAYGARLARIDHLQVEYTEKLAERDTLAQGAPAETPHRLVQVRRQCERLAGEIRRLRARLRADVCAALSGRAA